MSKAPKTSKSPVPAILLTLVLTVSAAGFGVVVAGFYGHIGQPHIALPIPENEGYENLEYLRAMEKDYLEGGEGDWSQAGLPIDEAMKKVAANPTLLAPHGPGVKANQGFINK